MKNSSKTLLAVLAIAFVSCGLVSQQAQATPMVMISGDINFAGDVAFNTTSLLTATQVNTWFDIFGNAGHSTVTAGNTGTFTSVPPGTQATMAQPWVFGFTNGGPQPGLWSVGGFTFDLTSSHVVVRSASQLGINGTGIVSGNGFTPTHMDWAFSAQSAGGQRQVTFSFSSNGSAVPDGGPTVALLGLALTGIEVLRRKLRVT